MSKRWISFDAQEPPVDTALDDPSVAVPRRVLVTNNIKARNRMGQMSHVWLARPQKQGKEWVALDDNARCIEFLTHWFDPLADRDTDGGSMTWTPLTDELPPEGVIVWTKIDDIKGPRNEQRLMRQGRLWYFPDGSMYVYYTPTHWREED